ncbi:hypothetical protein VNI00_002262 [Paramarasmius palmivorus]|uniref:Uncharacterized protein n=1 Tax=Paramarasmius palmivorus TaxID=297713 RepID=A0AAW0E0T6_9AGAR
MTPATQFPSFSTPSTSSNQGAYVSAPRDEFDPEVESDIVDQYGNLEFASESLIPPRPDSRLDFHNGVEMADGQETCVDTDTERPPFNVPPRSSRLEWTKSLFQRIGFRSSVPRDEPASTENPLEGDADSGFDDVSNSTTSFRTTTYTFLHQGAAAADGVMIDDISFTFCSSDEETDSSDGESEIDVDCLSDLDAQDPDSPLPPPSSAIAEMITISEDFSSSSTMLEPIIFAPNPSPASSSSILEDAELPVKEKFSCLPSLFSPQPRQRSIFASPQPQRHNYEHRGHSRHSLLHMKWFWATREEEWAEYTVCAQHIPAYGGISTSPEIPVAEQFPSLFASARDTPPNSTRATPPASPPTPPMPPLSVHPRWGDLSGLRDPWCTHMDRYFVDIPMWRIRKSLWTADMEVLAMVHARLSQKSDGDDECPDSCATSSCGDAASLQMSMLTGYSDDSDLTLVDSDNEEEADESTRLPESQSDVSQSIGKAAFDLEGDEEFFEDVDISGPTASSSSSSYPLYSASSSASSFDHATPTIHKPFPMQTHFQTTSLQTPFCPPYSPNCPYSLKQLGHPWATCWYQRSQLLLQLWGLGQPTTPTLEGSIKRQGKAPMVGLGLSMDVVAEELDEKCHSHNDSGFGIGHDMYPFQGLDSDIAASGQ